MILFFSTSAPHYHTDIRPNDCYNACAHTLAPTWALTHPPPVTLPLSTTHLGHFILSKPPCTTNGPSLAPSPSLFAPSFSLFLPVYCGMMDANGYLLNWISSQDGDKLGNAFFFSLPPALLKLFWALFSSAECGENVNEEDCWTHSTTVCSKPALSSAQ